MIQTTLQFSARNRTALAFFAALLPLLLPVNASAQEASRVLALGGAVTEIVYALGEEDRLIGRDSTSTYPAAALELPDVGYVRALSPEGVLSIGPDLIIAIEGSGPPEALEVLQAADVPWVTVPEGYDGAAIRAKIEIVAEALGVPAKGAELAANVDAALAVAIGDAAQDTPPRVMFILSMAGGRIMAAGEDTSADAIIRLAGGANALGGFEGYQPISDEAVLVAQPDVILMMDRGGDHGAGNAEIVAHPALGQTPAAQSGAVVRQPGMLLLGFGPRTPTAVAALSEAIDLALAE